MEFTGIVISITHIVSGQSAHGSWQNQNVIFEQKSNHRKLCVSFLNKPQIVENLKIGEEYNVFFNIESKEYNGKWYNSIRAWRVVDVEGKTIGAKIQLPNTVKNEQVSYDSYEDDIDYEAEMVRQFERQCEEDERRQLLSTDNIFDASAAFGHNAWALNAYLSNKNKW